MLLIGCWRTLCRVTVAWKLADLGFWPAPRRWSWSSDPVVRQLGYPSTSKPVQLAWVLKTLAKERTKLNPVYVKQEWPLSSSEPFLFDLSPLARWHTRGGVRWPGMRWFVIPNMEYLLGRFRDGASSNIGNWTATPGLEPEAPAWQASAVTAMPQPHLVRYPASFSQKTPNHSSTFINACRGLDFSKENGVILFFSIYYFLVVKGSFHMFQDFFYLACFLVIEPIRVEAPYLVLVFIHASESVLVWMLVKTSEHNWITLIFK